MARKVARKERLSQSNVEDIKQDAIVKFIQTIKRNRSLGLRLKLGEYGPFLATVILRCCQNGSRQFRKSRFVQTDLAAQCMEYDDRRQIDQQLDIRELIANVAEPNRTILRLTLHGLTLEEIAQRLRKSKRTISRRLNASIEQVQRLDEKSSQPNQVKDSIRPANSSRSKPKPK